ncbi:MAG: lysostaphin resistance A-like protein [Acidimicrobiia bacterium]
MGRSWTVVDFILIWLGGFLGTGIFVALASLLDSADAAVVLGLAGQYLGNLGVLWVVARTKHHGDLGFSIEGRDLLYLAPGALLQITLALLFLPLARILFPEGEVPQQVADALADAGSSTLLKVSLVSAAVVLAPIAEELMFRGVLARALAPRGRRTVILGTALVFSAVHVIGLDPNRLLASAAVVLPPIFILGVVLAWATVRSGRLGPAIFLHSGYNLLAAVVLLVPSELLEKLG